MGATVECWPSNQQNTHPFFSTFILSLSDYNGNVKKVYGASLTFYENYDRNILNTEQLEHFLKANDNRDNNDKTFKSNKCILVLSCHPFFDVFKNFLYFLMKLSTSSSTLPIETYILHLINNVPFPTIQKPCVLVNLTKDDIIPIYLPEECILPQR